MKYDLCSSCQFLQVRLLTEKESIPKHCKCPYLRDVFGLYAGGFPSGIDIIHCEYHLQWPLDYGDVKLVHLNDNKKGVSYVLTQPRNFKKIRVPQLYNNQQNIKQIFIENDK